MRGIRMADRSSHLTRALDRVVIEPQIDLGDPREVVEPHLPTNGVARQLQNAVVSRKDIERGLVIADTGNTVPAGVILQLQEAHGSSSLSIVVIRIAPSHRPALQC
jgi:hypothetical protein